MDLFDYVAMFKEGKWRKAAQEQVQRDGCWDSRKIKEKICGDNKELNKLFEEYEYDLMQEFDDKNYILNIKYLNTGVKIGMELQRFFNEEE